MRPIPAELRTGPFTLDRAKELKLTPRMLEGQRFVRLFPRVYRVVEYEMERSDWVAAARLALPEDAVPTGITRIQMAGLDYGPLKPLRFVVARDHHISFNGLFLHRTKMMPPTDTEGVVLAAAFIAYCARARVIDAIKVGDWLLHNTSMTKAAVRDLALAQLWRDGADEAIWILDHLDGESRSLPESETRAVLEFAGLPRPEVNKLLHLEEGLVVMPDLLYRALGVLVEYEGGQHQEEREQYTSDLDRYAALRRHQLRYVQVTKEKLRQPKRLVEEVYRELSRPGTTAERRASASIGGCCSCRSPRRSAADAVPRATGRWVSHRRARPRRWQTHRWTAHRRMPKASGGEAARASPPVFPCSSAGVEAADDVCDFETATAAPGAAGRR